MGNKKVLQLIQGGIKKKEIRLLKRTKKTPPDVTNREIHAAAGEVWGILDRHVPFDFNRSAEEIKEKLRPCLILATPHTFADTDYIHMAPGTTHPHPVGKHYPPCYRADVPPELLPETTWFLLYFSWHIEQRFLSRHFTGLSKQAKEIVAGIRENRHA